MNTLLIVEDEKMIRQGIAVMAKRCSVEIAEILECRNGLEALEILKNREIDVMFTDIRMPKMDGIELVKETENLKRCPKIVVVSGYDDFNYAVEMLKHGVKDYILKPVKREKIEELLKKLDAEISGEKKLEGIELQTFTRELKAYLNQPAVPEKELEPLRWKFEQYMGQEPYLAVAGARQKNEDEGEERQEGLYLEIDGQGICFVKAAQAEEILESGWFTGAVGISGEHRSFKECAAAYREAAEARLYAYFRGLPQLRFIEMPAGKDGGTGSAGQRVPEEFISHFVSQFPTEHMEKAVMSFKHLLFEARHGQTDMAAVIESGDRLQTELTGAYKKMVSEEKQPFFDMEPPLAFSNADEYEESFCSWIRQIRGCLDEVYDSNQNRNKIRTAVRYVEENFRTDLNMAMVSNYVSMNYSLFSIAFKEYTGVNFVSYLKNLRIEEAKRLLETTDEKVQDIGRRVGFESDKHFLKSFKAACGISPSDYRRNAGLGEITKTF